MESASLVAAKQYRYHVGAVILLLVEGIFFAAETLPALLDWPHSAIRTIMEHRTVMIAAMNEDPTKDNYGKPNTDTGHRMRWNTQLQ